MIVFLDEWQWQLQPYYNYNYKYGNTMGDMLCSFMRMHIRMRGEAERRDETSVLVDAGFFLLGVSGMAVALIYLYKDCWAACLVVGACYHLSLVLCFGVFSLCSFLFVFMYVWRCGVCCMHASFHLMVYD